MLHPHYCKNQASSAQNAALCPAAAKAVARNYILTFSKRSLWAKKQVCAMHFYANLILLIIHPCFIVNAEFKTKAGKSGGTIWNFDVKNHIM